MKLSILIAMYNAEKYIDRCLDSLANQELSYDEYEVLVMDDCSTDRSVEVVKDFISSSQCTIILHESSINEGPYTKRNRALELAKGTYCYFADADDYLAHNSLHLPLQLAFENNLDLMGFKALKTKEGNCLDFQEEDIEKCTTIDIQTGRQFLAKNRYTHFELWWYLIRKEYLDSTGIRFYQGKFHADVNFTLRVFYGAARSAFCPLNVYRYFLSDNSIIRGHSPVKRKLKIESFKTLIAKLNEFINELELNDETDSRIKDNLVYRRKEFIFVWLYSFSKARYKIEDIKHIISFLKAANVFPLEKFRNNEYSNFKVGVLNLILGNPIMMYPYLMGRRMLSSKKIVV